MGIDPGIQRAIDAQKAAEPPFNTDDSKLKRFLNAAHLDDVSHPDITVHEDLCVRTPPPGRASRGAPRPPPPGARPAPLTDLRAPKGQERKSRDQIQFG